MDLALNNLQRLICPKTQPTNQDCKIKFRLQLHYYVHSQANTLGKGMNSIILLAVR